MDSNRLLAIYLNDHLAGATAGRALAARSFGSNRGTAYGDDLAWFLIDVERDVQVLREVMRRVGAAEDPFKRIAALATERVGRLKLNGRLLGYSPLSRLVEIEGLVLGIRGKLAMWELLSQLGLPELADMPFDDLMERARTQITRIEANRQEAGKLAFLG